MHFEKQTPTILQLGFRSEALPALKKYIDLLWKTNEALNLISRKMSFEDLIDNHLIDCLLPLQHFPCGLKQVADFGSGGGLPAVIYALQFPDTTFCLYEKSKLKQEFLHLCQEIAPNLQVCGDIPTRLENIELVSARGFKPLDVILDMSRDYYQKNGSYFLLKGRFEKINEESLLARKKFKDVEIKTIPLTSPVLNVERHLVRLQKKTTVTKN